MRKQKGIQKALESGTCSFLQNSTRFCGRDTGIRQASYEYIHTRLKLAKRLDLLAIFLQPGKAYSTASFGPTPKAPGKTVLFDLSKYIWDLDFRTKQGKNAVQLLKKGTIP